MKMAWWVENPDTSWWWRQRKWRRYRDSRGPDIFRACFCRFGCRWKKPTRVATNTRLKGLRMWCTCKRPHFQLRGTCRARGIPWTQIAEPYPNGFATMLAAAVASQVGWADRKKLNIARCARVGSLRVGEASHPGPRARGGRHGYSLEEVNRVSPATLAIQSRELQKFFDWCDAGTGARNFAEVFKIVPMALPPCLRSYGDLLFQRGGSLFNLRHLILACQNWCPMSKPYMQIAWELVERWEMVMPVVHRTPVPEVLVKALCGVAQEMVYMGWCDASGLLRSWQTW